MIMNYDVHGEKLHEYHVHITATYHHIFFWGKIDETHYIPFSRKKYSSN